jgi:hypothetical protein
MSEKREPRLGNGGEREREERKLLWSGGPRRWPRTSPSATTDARWTTLADSPVDALCEMRGVGMREREEREREKIEERADILIDNIYIYIYCIPATTNSPPFSRERNKSNSWAMELRCAEAASRGAS